LGVAVK